MPPQVDAQASSQLLPTGPEGQSGSLASRLEPSSTSGPPPSPPSDQGRGPPLTRLLLLATSAYFQMAIDSAPPWLDRIVPPGHQE